MASFSTLAGPADSTYLLLAISLPNGALRFQREGSGFFAEYSVRVEFLHGGRPWRAELSGPLFDAARRALEEAFGRAPVIVGEGGSIPVVGDFQRVLGAPVLLVGFGLPGENAHAPNEWISDANFTTGMRAIARLWDVYGGGVR